MENAFTSGLGFDGSSIRGFRSIEGGIGMVKINAAVLGCGQPLGRNHVTLLSRFDRSTLYMGEKCL